jgi:hypothetical protein
MVDSHSITGLQGAVFTGFALGLGFRSRSRRSARRPAHVDFDGEEACPTRSGHAARAQARGRSK